VTFEGERCIEIIQTVSELMGFSFFLLREEEEKRRKYRCVIYVGLIRLTLEGCSSSAGGPAGTHKKMERDAVCATSIIFF